MTSYFDTSVLIAAISPRHALHQNAREIIISAFEEGQVVTTTHTYGEIYRTITRPTKYNLHISPQQAEIAIIEGIGKQLSIVELTKSDYEAAIRRCRQLELVNAIIYDALHYEAALKAGASVLYTDNLKDFTRLQLPGEELRIAGIR